MPRSARGTPFCATSIITCMVSPIPRPIRSKNPSNTGMGVAGSTVASSASPTVASAVPMIGKTR